MDPERVHAYLQVACAGLGFDIGEVWWTSDENGSSSLAAIEAGEHHDGGDGKKFRFVQLYTSRSYESRRSELVNPPEESSASLGLRRSGSSDNLQKHVLSPRLVDAISKTAQVVWATTKKQEGLIGRSDIRLQTAVGMPVAMDSNGNMCVVVMFSPNNVQSTDDAMEYLHSISLSATSSSIPCLLPVFDASNGMKQITHSVEQSHRALIPHPDPSSLGEGVSARFVSLDDTNMFQKDTGVKTLSDEPEVHSDHDLSAAPKDTFGIPMLPTSAELGQVTPPDSDDPGDAFDEATYGIWTTVMEDDDDKDESNSSLNILETLFGSKEQKNDGLGSSSSLSVSSFTLVPTLPPLKESQKERLVEFCSAFLGMSVFDMADVWVPSGENGPFPSDTLRHAATVASTQNPVLEKFRETSESTLIKFWTGAVGRAFSTGNPVWSSNEDSFIDIGRIGAFQQAQFRTVLAVPVFSKSAVTPACVVVAYAFVKSGSVPFVLRFVQQALRLLWDGLDRIDQPHVADNVWQNVAPADLGEMAADVEMQQHFHDRKRSHQTMMIASTETMHLPANDGSPSPPTQSPVSEQLSAQLQSIELPNGDVISIPLHFDNDGAAVAPPPSSAQIAVEELQDHVNEAVRSVAQAVQLDAAVASTNEPVLTNEPGLPQHVNTNLSGSKRAHVISTPGVRPLAMPTPLAMPRPLPSRIVPGNNARTSQPAPLRTPVAAINRPQAPLQVPPPAIGGFGAPPMVLPVADISNELNIPQAQQQQQQPVVAQPTLAQPEQPLSASFCVPIGSTASNGAGFNMGVPPPVVAGKICRIQGCSDPAVAKRPYCAKHSGSRVCEHEGCSKCAQGSTRFCIAHGGGRRCTFPGCDKGARDKFFCAAHGGGKRCQFPGGCTKSAVGGSSLCTAHGGGRRCDVPGCGKSAQSSTRFCVKHGGGKKCSHEGCEKVARGRTRFCAAHGGGVRCKLDGCNRVAIGKLQLCRAHGGGSSRGSRASPPSVDPSSPDGVPQVANMILNGTGTISGLATL